jgi:hypothetical protein
MLVGRPGWLTVLLVSLPLGTSAAKIACVTVADRATLGTSDMVLNGAGLRKMTFVRVYVGALYLSEKRTSPAEVYALAGAKRISITLLRNLPARKFVDALKGGILENSSAGEQRALKGRVEALEANLLTLGERKKGDTITLDWLPDAGTLVVANGERKGKAIPGDDLYRALLRVFLGDRPTNAGLKQALLGHTER